MSTQAISLPAIEQYLDSERKAEFGSEYLNSHVYAMSGGTLNHARIVRNTLAQFAETLRGARCEAAGSDFRLFCARYNVFTYPEVVVTCGPHKSLDERHDTITDTTFIAEVFSSSTKHYDRGEKFRYYRQPDGSWLFRELTSPGSEIEFNAIGCRLRLESLYEGVDFETET